MCVYFSHQWNPCTEKLIIHIPNLHIHFNPDWLVVGDTIFGRGNGKLYKFMYSRNAWVSESFFPELKTTWMASCDREQDGFILLAFVSNNEEAKYYEVTGSFLY